MTPWYILGACFAVSGIVAAWALIVVAHDQRKARKALTAASLEHALTVRRLDAAKAEARNVIRLADRRAAR